MHSPGDSKVSGSILSSASKWSQRVKELFPKLFNLKAIFFSQTPGGGTLMLKYKAAVYFVTGIPPSTLEIGAIKPQFSPKYFLLYNDLDCKKPTQWWPVQQHFVSLASARFKLRGTLEMNMLILITTVYLQKQQLISINILLHTTNKQMLVMWAAIDTWIWFKTRLILMIDNCFIIYIMYDPSVVLFVSFCWSLSLLFSSVLWAAVLFSVKHFITLKKSYIKFINLTKYY